MHSSHWLALQQCPSTNLMQLPHIFSACNRDVAEMTITERLLKRDYLCKLEYRPCIVGEDKSYPNQQQVCASFHSCPPGPEQPTNSKYLHTGGCPRCCGQIQDCECCHLRQIGLHSDGHHGRQLDGCLWHAIDCKFADKRPHTTDYAV